MGIWERQSFCLNKAEVCYLQGQTPKKDLPLLHSHKQSKTTLPALVRMSDKERKSSVSTFEAEED